MILTEPDTFERVDTREEVRRPGPYCDGLAVYMHTVTFYASDGDDFASAGDGGAWAMRSGRRVLWVDSQGFMVSTRYATVEEATRAMDEEFRADDMDAGECEVLTEVAGTPSGEFVGTCACGRPIYRSRFAGTIYHATEDGVTHV